MSQQIELLDEAIKRGGGIVAFSKSMGVSHQVVYQWKKRGYVPTERALIIERKFGLPHAQMIRSDLADILSA